MSTPDQIELPAVVPAEWLPCPFCGGVKLDEIQCLGDEGGDYVLIECSACLGAAPKDRWNRRA